MSASNLYVTADRSVYNLPRNIEIVKCICKFLKSKGMPLGDDPKTVRIPASKEGGWASLRDLVDKAVEFEIHGSPK